ncbi:tail fiber domain-containing protein [Bdellovibrio sp. HCB337]|uniref:phage tail fiber protein n=1 Tax=Bdellovibrio sp. HCB337 TaxID=3394358 RepID=UPI0039A4CEAC
MKKLYVISLFIIFATGLSSLAVASPSSLNYQGRILKMDNTPMEYEAVIFNFKIMDSSGQYTLWEENSNPIDMTGSKGVFDVPLGEGARTFPDSNIQSVDVAYWTSFGLLDAFSNTRSFYCKGSVLPACYTPLGGDLRILRVRFWDGTAWRQISPDSKIRSVPFAAYSMSSEKLAGRTLNEFVLKELIPNCGSGSFLTWNLATQSFGCNSVSVSSSEITSIDASKITSGVLDASHIPNLSLAGDVTGTLSATHVSSLQGKTLSAAAPSNGQVLKYNGTAWVPSSDSVNAGTITEVVAGSGLIGGGTSGSVTLSINNSVTAGTYTKLTVNSLGLVTGGASLSSTDIPSLDWSKITTGTPTTVAGYGITDALTGVSNSANLSNGKIWLGNASGKAVEVSISGDATISNSGVLTVDKTQTAVASKILQLDASSVATTKGVNVNGSTSGSIAIRGQAAAGTYTLTLPNSAGAATQVLVTDGSGNLSWAANTAGSVTSVAASAPLSSTGGTTPTISIAQATTSQSGYLSSTDWNTFNNKQAAGNYVTALTGDVTATGPGSAAATVAKLQGSTLTLTTPAANQYIKYNGSAFVNSAIVISDVTNLSSTLSNKIDAAQMPANCTADQTLTFSSPTGAWTCANIAITGSAFGSQTASTFLAAPSGAAGAPSFRSIAAADVPVLDTSKVTTGTFAAARMPAFTGDATSSAGGTALTLANSGATAGTYKSVTVDAKGRVTAGTNPTTLAGYGITDAFAQGGNSFGTTATLGTNDATNLAFETGGTTRATLDTSGNLGLGMVPGAYRLDVSGSVRSSGEFVSTSANQARYIGGNYGVIHRNDGANYYTLLTASGDQYGSWNSLRPLSINVTNGDVNMGNGRLYVEHGGQVGIGTATPTQALHVVGNIQVDNGTNAAIYNSGGMFFSGVPGAGTHAGYVFRPGWGGGTNRLATVTVQNSDAAGNYNDCVLLASYGPSYFNCGPLGINTKNPNAALDVNGRIRSTGVAGGEDAIFELYNQQAPANQRWTEMYTDDFGTFIIRNLNDAYSAGATVLHSHRLPGSPNIDYTVLDGNVGIGFAPSYKFHANGTVAGVGAYVNASDIRLKKNIEPMSDVRTKLTQLTGVYFDWRQDEYPEMNFEQTHDVGVIAQDVEKVFPEAVKTDSKGFKSVAYSKLVAPLIEAVKELYAKVQGHDEEIKSLKQENAELKVRLDRLEKIMSDSTASKK